MAHHRRLPRQGRREPQEGDGLTLGAAIRNNAAWCDAVCRAHGGATGFEPELWRNAGPSPRFYPDLITLTPGSVDAQLAAIRGLPPAASVKDSFATLDLAPLGFKVLFEAQWQMRTPVGAPDDGIERIDNQAALTEWERAWANDPSAPRTFLPPLLDDPNIAFIGLRRDRVLVAGAIFNIAVGVCGVSNTFGAVDDVAHLLAFAVRFAPGLSLVGYAQQPMPGFEPLGPLRIWTRA